MIPGKGIKGVSGAAHVLTAFLYRLPEVLASESVLVLPLSDSRASRCDRPAVSGENALARIEQPGRAACHVHPHSRTRTQFAARTSPSHARPPAPPTGANRGQMASPYSRCVALRASDMQRETLCVAPRIVRAAYPCASPQSPAPAASTGDVKMSGNHGSGRSERAGPNSRSNSRPHTLRLRIQSALPSDA